MGTKIQPSDTVRVDGHMVSEPDTPPVYLAFNKPVGIVCTTDTRVEPDNIIDYINYPSRIFPIGRLDKPSDGLILLTNDGDIVNKILRARNNHEKEYLVTVHKRVTPDFIQKMGSGIPILGTVTRKCTVEQTGPSSFRMVLTQGLNRQIRRMCEYLGYEVTKLRRTRIMNIELDVPVGQWRDLTSRELNDLQLLLTDSEKIHAGAEGARPDTDRAANKSKPARTGNTASGHFKGGSRSGHVGGRKKPSDGGKRGQRPGKPGRSNSRGKRR